MTRRTPIRRSRRIRAVSPKRRSALADYVAFRLGILSRDGYRCAYCRTQRGALDVHHVTKRSADPSVLLDAERCVTLCRTCHGWTDASYASAKGRLVVEAIGGGRFVFSVVRGASKWAVRAAGAV
jgi:5-methylcytosine-specific restriction endonuclease McrA